MLGIPNLVLLFPKLDELVLRDTFAIACLVLMAVLADCSKLVLVDYLAFSIITLSISFFFCNLIFLAQEAIS